MMKNHVLLIVFSCFFIFDCDAQNGAVSVNLFSYPPGNNNERSLRDGVAVFFNGQADSVDLFDIKKLTNPLENIAILRNGILLAGEQRNSLDTIPLTLWNLQTGDYELEIFTRDMGTIFLENVATHSITSIAAADTLRYRFTNTIPNSPPDSSISFRLLFDTVPPVIPPVHPPCGNYHHNNHEPHNIDYRTKLYPNPVYGTYISVEMHDLQPGSCRVSFIGAATQLSYSFVHGNDLTEQVNISDLPKGKYYCIIEDEEGWKETRQIEID